MREPIRQGDIPGIQLRIRQQLDVGVEEAWSWLVDPRKLGQWLALRAELEPGTNGHLLLESEGEQGGIWQERGETLEIEPPRRWILAFRWCEANWTADTILELEIRSVAQGAELSLLHRGFERLPLSSCLTVWEAYRRRWRAALRRLEEVSSPVS